MTQELKRLITEWQKLGNKKMVAYLHWYAGLISAKAYKLTLK